VKTAVTGQFLMILAIWVLSSVCAHAHIKLVSLPEREAVIIRLENRSATLVEEERVLTLQKGINRVDFSWKNVDIDPDSVRLNMLNHPDQVTLLNVSYPPSESSMVWEIASEEAWEEKVRLSYLLKNIDGLVAYNVLADQAEKQVDLRGHLILRNFSGEDFEKARIYMDFGESFEQKIVHGETRQNLLFTAGKVPLEKVWIFDARIHPWDPARLDMNAGIPVRYRIKNTEKNNLGQFGLPGGKVRVFQEDNHGSTIFLGEDKIDYISTGEKAEINIGDSRDILVTQQRMQYKKINIRRNEDNRIVLYDTDEKIYAKMENFKDQPAVLTLIQHIEGHWDMAECNMKYRLKDSNTLEFEVPLAPGEKKELNMHYRRRNVR
jgi:hypothetical protein